MKIVQIVTQMEAAGVQKVASLLHEGFLKRGHASELWFLYTKSATYAGLQGVSSMLDHQPSTRENFSLTSKLYSRLRRNRPDAVVKHTPYDPILEQAIAAAAHIRKRVAVHHTPFSTYPWPARLTDCLFCCTGVYSNVVVVSDAVKRSTPRFLRCYSRAHRIHNGVEPAGRTGLADTRAKWRIPRHKPLLLSVGRLSVQKNHQSLFRALSMVPEACLVVVGDGELASECKQLVEQLSLGDRVVFTGELSQQEVYGLMTSADLFVFPSLWEGLSMAALEAIGRGMATVASDISPNREVFGDAALFVPATDVNALANAIARVLGDAALANGLRVRAVARARSFSVETMIDEYDRLLCEN